MKLNIKKIARDKVGDYTVNTTALDDVYETAIKLNDGNYVIVQKYKDETHAKIGHKVWIEFCENKPIYATDITTNKKVLF